jgi:hypothetical protein
VILKWEQAKQRRGRERRRNSIIYASLLETTIKVVALAGDAMDQ